jgi:hypothetical protein
MLKHYGDYIDQNKSFKKDHVKVYRALVDDFLRFHQLKWILNHFGKFYLKAQKFSRFSMHECNAHIGFLSICVL